MTHTDTTDSAPDESRVDDLLREFFASEMPADLRRLEKSEPLPLVRKAVAAGPARRPTAVQLSALAVCLVLAGLVFWVSTSGRNQPAGSVIDTLDGASLPVENGVATVHQPDGHPPGFSLTEKVEPVESLTYNTVNGPVQQQTNVSTTNISFIEPGTGDLLEMVLPELTIEIFPIDDAPKGERKLSPNDLDIKQNGIDPPVLLPEQQSGSSKSR